MLKRNAVGSRKVEVEINLSKQVCVAVRVARLSSEATGMCMCMCGRVRIRQGKKRDVRSCSLCCRAGDKVGVYCRGLVSILNREPERKKGTYHDSSILALVGAVGSFDFGGGLALSTVGLGLVLGLSFGDLLTLGFGLDLGAGGSLLAVGLGLLGRGGSSSVVVVSLRINRSSLLALGSGGLRGLGGSLGGSGSSGSVVTTVASKKLLRLFLELIELLSVGRIVSMFQT